MARNEFKASLGLQPNLQLELQDSQGYRETLPQNTKTKKTETPNKKTKTNPSTNKRKQLTYINNGNKKTLPEILFY